jgi:hypothetical protein
MSFQPETFAQFYARLSANRKAEIIACTDPVKREELIAWDAHFEAQWKAAWQMKEAKKGGFQSGLTEDEQWERQHRPEIWRSRTVSEDNGSYRVIDGKAW